ncbi:MAG TPA: ABC-F family ATP-binding cassette domain-containing protein [Bacillota bacterium]|jgi:ATP-binding cassette subfamily F protein 3|nr:ABC-F family ATP-binding cassette domain-containing protein [Bacillota bacterium]HOL08581.1 ABC-F family ATP-binding cassette domain-containing protein [Bacillota bacterium]HPO97805.1 ABC-F family ATP-binding cassette domain-containing protein [Bacillota bacterium]
MALLQVENLEKFYGATAILKGINLEINHGEKWALVGRNGCGKTTLINILTKIEDYDRGEVRWAQNCRIGYLPQQPVFDSEKSIYHELRSVFKDLDHLQQRINNLQEQMNTPGISQEELDSLINEFHRLNEEFETAGGYQIEGRIQGVLRGLGFPTDRWNDSAVIMSGGEKTRLALAKLLLLENDLLILDEPTNYLDLAAVEWLENFLADYQGAVLLVSHDRHFLNKVVQGFLEIEFGKVKRYKGNYTAYRQQKEEQLKAQTKAYLKQAKELARLERFVREAGAGEKIKRKAHSIEKRLAKEERIEKPKINDKTMLLKFETNSKSSRNVLQIENLAKKYDNKVILNNASFQLEAGDKVGLIGPNGVGKTTLLRMILGFEKPDQGLLRLGYEVYPGYFSQIEDESDLEGTPFSQLVNAFDLDNTEARTILGHFLFSGEDVFKQVKDLSGGERRRLGLIKLMLSPANFLILDEPTNHLDLDSIEVIEEALAGYDGTIMVVSHDRYFLERVVDRYIAIIDGELFHFESYNDYHNYITAQESPAANKRQNVTKSDAQLQREQSKELQRQLRRAQRNLAEVETEINNLELRKDELYNLLNDPQLHADYIKSMELSKELETIDQTLNELYQKWEELQNLIAAEF